MGVQTIDRDRPFATRLRSLREDRGWTQAELARLAGLSLPTVYLLEQGRRINPSLTTARKLAKVFGLTTDEIMA